MGSKYLFKESNKDGCHSEGQDLTTRAVLFFPLYSFMVIYQPDARPIRILAVLRGSRNLKRILQVRL